MSIFRNLFLLEDRAIKKIMLDRQGKKWKNIVKSYGPFKGVLSSQEIKEAEEFWRPFAGSRIDPLFHAWYKKSTGVFHPEIVPEDIWYTKIDYYFNDRETAKRVDNKCLYDYFFSNVNLPINICKRISGLWFSENMVLNGVAEAAAIASQYDSVFLKIANGSCGGKGVFFLSGKEIPEKIKELNGTIENDIVIQKPIIQHEALGRLSPSSVNTLRVLSLLRSEGVNIYSVILRMGIDGSKVDNVSSGGITCGVTEEGRLKPVAYSARGDSYSQHPTTNVKFDEIVIPNYKKVLQNTKMLAMHFPMFRMVSWDWTVDETGEPLLVEANLYNGALDFHQLNNGPIFKSDTNMVLSEVFGKRKADKTT